MRTECANIACILMLAAVANAASTPKTHVVVLGRATTISLRGEDGPEKDLKARPLYVDGRLKEFTTGKAHDVTERTFVIQRIYRINDSLPQENGSAQWRWQLGGWLLVDRTTGKVQIISMPELDSTASVVSWFRDYAAYCGMSDDGQKLAAVVMELGTRKPLLKKNLGDAKNLGAACAAPVWERGPVRVIFEPTSGQKLAFLVERRAASEVTESEQTTADDNNDGE